MNLTLKTEKQEMNYLNYSNALCVGLFWISYCPSRQYIAKSDNIALLGNRPGLVVEITNQHYFVLYLWVLLKYLNNNIIHTIRN